jgi:SAM-dependent methyltransferase
MQNYSFQRYLSAKKSVDDRALNRQVQEVLVSRLSLDQKPLQVLEIGAGIGTMLERLSTWGLKGRLEYIGIDAEPENINTAWQRLPIWANTHGYQVHQAETGTIELVRAEQQVLVRFETVNLFEFARQAIGLRQWDLQIAHAFLDLMDIPATLPYLFNLIRPQGLFYYTINFDGVTTFEPVIDPKFDALVELEYHRTMDERITDGRQSGDSRAGRHLFSHLKAAGASLLAAGASDWVVYPQATGYPEDEAYFLHFIVHTLHQALSGAPKLDSARFEDWISERHAQIERGELVYIAHQLDFVGHPHANPVLYP